MAAHSILLPNTLKADYDKWALASRTLEPFVNGLWLSIVRHHFELGLQSLKYTINPELRLRRGNFSDLLMVKNFFDTNDDGELVATNKWQIIIEGKRVHANNTFRGTIAQLATYATQIEGANGWCYLIAAIGDRCMFWRFQKWHMCRIQPMYVQVNTSTGARTVRFNEEAPQIPAPESTAYTITNDEDQQNIIKLLTWIKDHPNNGTRETQ
ncbi:hypothetical protein H0H92_010668 [Tricholoma furcatifolium]|nr:hypothetical protein H0H92_010668 [Tricholoma furcatifolium]